VARVIAANPDSGAMRNREQDVTVMLLDISGYTRLSERLPLADLNDLIERYFAAFLDCVVANDGDINDFAGDGFAAVFRDSEPIRHASAAVRTALALQAMTAKLNGERLGSPLGIHIGINSGRAFFGSTHLEGARGTRWILRVSGLVMNLAARLAAVAPEGEIVVGGETANRVRSTFVIEELGLRALKNITEPVMVYRVVGEAV